MVTAPGEFVVAEGLDVLILGPDEVLIQFGTRSRPSELFRDTEFHGYLGVLFQRLLEGPSTTEDLLGLAPQEDHQAIRDMLADLSSGGLICAPDKNPLEQYIHYSLGLSTSLADKIASTIGAGPLGTRISYNLLQHGIGKLQLLDGRYIDRNGMAFQPIDTAMSINSPVLAHVALQERLTSLGYANCTQLPGGLSLEGIETAVTSSDLVVLALEYPGIGLAQLVNRLCVRESKPWILACIDGDTGLAGPLFTPPHTACYNDLDALSDANIGQRSIARRYRRHVMSGSASKFSTGLPEYADIVAGYTTLAAVEHLIGSCSFLLSRLMRMNFPQMSIDMEDVLRMPRCPVCKVDKPAYQPLVPNAFSSDWVANADNPDLH